MARVHRVPRRRRRPAPPCPLLPHPGRCSQLASRSCQACTGMGGEFSKEDRRLDEVEKRLAKAKAMVESLHAAAASDAARAAPAAAGMPAAPGSNKAWLDAARQYYQQLHDEKIAICVRMGEHGPVQPALRGQVMRRVCLFGVAAWAAFLKCLPACLPVFPSTDLSRSVWPVWAVTCMF